MTGTITSVSQRIQIMAFAGVLALIMSVGTSAASRPAETDSVGTPRIVNAADTLTAREAFVRLPISVLDLLDRSTRLDMLDYADVDSVWNAPNALEGISRLTALTDDYARVEVTRVSTLEIKILHTRRDPVVMTLYTVGDPDNAPDTEMRFFDARFRPLETDRYFKTPKVGDFLDVPHGVKMDRILEMIPFPTTTYSVSPDGDILTGRLTLCDEMPRENYDVVHPYVRPDVRWRWNGSRWQPEK